MQCFLSYSPRDETDPIRNCSTGGDGDAKSESTASGVRMVYSYAVFLRCLPTLSFYAESAGGPRLSFLIEIWIPILAPGGGGE